MQPPVKQEDKREYTIKIIPHNGETVHSAHLPIKKIKYGIATLVAGVAIFVGAFGIATYGAVSNHLDEQEVKELREVNTVHQQHLTELAKKADKLQEEMLKLNQLEAEIRQITSTDVTAMPADSSQPIYDGQGGPYIKPSIKNVSDTLDALELRIKEKRISLERLKEKVHEQKQYEIYQHQLQMAIPGIMPAEGEISSYYGMRWGGTDFHPGIDIANDYGTPIVSTATGTVVEAGWNSGGYGYMVDIDHGNGILTRYAHAEEIVVSVGQYVERGQVIAYMGSTGFSTGPHLHYEIQINGEAVNPEPYI